MTHRLINFVLAVLMLMPAGICTCDGGVVSCPDHPSGVPTQSASAEQAHSGCNGAGYEAAQTAGPHQCPDPSPHETSCRILSPEMAIDVSTSDSSGSSVFLPPALHFVVVAWPAAPPSRLTCAPVDARVTTSPLYLTHCVLLI